MKVLQVIDQIENLEGLSRKKSQSMLGFTSFIITMLLLSIVGIARFSKLSEIVNVCIIIFLGIMLSLMLVATIIAYFRDPKMLIYNQYGLLADRSFSDNVINVPSEEQEKLIKAPTKITIANESKELPES